MPSGLISMSSGLSGCISTAAVSGLKGVVERPWKDDDQSMAGLVPLAVPLPFPLRAAAKAGEGGLLVSGVGISAARAGSTSATVAAGRMAAWGSMGPLTPLEGVVGGPIGDFDFAVASGARARDEGIEAGGGRGRAVYDEDEAARACSCRRMGDRLLAARRYCR